MGAVENGRHRGAGRHVEVENDPLTQFKTDANGVPVNDWRNKISFVFEVGRDNPRPTLLVHRPIFHPLQDLHLIKYVEQYEVLLVSVLSVAKKQPCFSLASIFLFVPLL